MYNAKKHRRECASHYARNKQYYFDRNKKVVAAKREWLNQYKETRGCSRCGEKFPAFVLDFHHREPTKKRGNVGTMVGLGWQTIKAEVEKCDVLCANCHRIIEHTAL